MEFLIFKKFVDESNNVLYIEDERYLCAENEIISYLNNLIVEKGCEYVAEVRTEVGSRLYKIN